MTSHGWVTGEGSPIKRNFAIGIASLEYINKVHLSKDENSIIIEFEDFKNVNFNNLLKLLRDENIDDIRIIFGGPTFPEH
jgi:hypothetical protein